MGARLAWVGCWLWLAGCVGVPWRPEALQQAVRVESLALGFQEGGRGTLEVGLAVDNPTSDDAVLTDMEFELVVDGKRLAVGAQRLEVALAAGASHALALRFPLEAGRAKGTAVALYRAVRLTGRVVLRFGEDIHRGAPFRHERVLRLPWAPMEDPEPE